MAARSDRVDELLEQWRRARPDLSPTLDAMGTIGRLGRLNSLARADIESVLAKHGLNIAEFDVLAALRRSGEPFVLRPIDLARTLMLSPAGMTSRLDRLEDAGHIARLPDRDDRRSVLVELTPVGKRVVDAAVSDHLANENRLLEPLSPTQRATLDQYLRRLLAQFDDPEQP